MSIKPRSSCHSNRRCHVLAEALEPRTLLTTIVVNSTSDANSLPSGQTDLRMAINKADSATSSTTITFDSSKFGSHRTITLVNYALELSNTHESISIKGPASGVTINANENALLQIDGKVKASLSNITLTDGAGFPVNPFVSYGGGLFNHGTTTLSNVHVDGNGYETDGGGGIWNDGTISMTGGSVSNNVDTGITNEGVMTLTDVAMSGDSSPGVGAIENDGRMTLIDVDISNNTAETIAGIDNTGSMTMTNVTLSGNRASQDLDSSGCTGAIYNIGRIDMTNVTLVGNSAGPDSDSGPEIGGINNQGTINMGNCIISGNTGNVGPDVYGTVNSLGHNLIGNTVGSSGWKSTDLTGTSSHPLDAKLGPLANNGGSTLTMLPQSHSPVINAGSNSLIPAGITTDQRGDPRIIGGTVDIGAVEVQLPTVISGTVFNDANKNGKKDSGEAGLAGWEVFDDANNNGKLDSGETLSFTTSSGSYGLGILGAGTAHIREIAPSNWSRTTPSNNGSISITLSPGSSHTNENFGDHTSIKYLSTVATSSGIVAWWTFDSASQANSILNGYTGTLKGGATISGSAGAPISGDAGNTGLSLNGTSAFVNTDLTTQDEFTTAVTLNVWVNLGGKVPAAGKIETILAKSQFQNDMDLQLESDGRIYFYTDNTIGASFKPATLTGWHMLTAEFDTAAKTREIFWDGKLAISTHPFTEVHAPSVDAFSIGESDVFTGRFFDGSIDEATLWNRALTSSEVAAIYAASK